MFNYIELNEMEVMQNPDISTDSQTNGFDLSAGNIWIYPENYPVREYQFNIVNKALYYNTLICLPTGKIIFCYFLKIIFISISMKVIRD